MKRFVVGLLVVSLTQAYAAAQKYQRPNVQTPSTYRGDPATQPDPQTIANLNWFQVFKDEKLQDLIREALTHNYDLRQAVARIVNTSNSLTQIIVVSESFTYQILKFFIFENLEPVQVRNRLRIRLGRRVTAVRRRSLHVRPLVLLSRGVRLSQRHNQQAHDKAFHCSPLA